MTKIVVIGGGHAAVQFIASIREGLPTADVTMISDESHLPYQRPPLSKGFLKDSGAAPAMLRGAGFYEEKRIGLQLGSKAVRIDCASKQVELDTSEFVQYDTLVLATGTRPRLLSLLPPGYDNVYYLRTVKDAQRIRAGLHTAANVTVVGGGYIGLEIAATAASLGCSVTVLEAASRLLNRSASPEISSYLLRKHREAGVDIRLEARANGVEAVGATVVGMHDGDNRIAVDMVIVGIGAVPNEELARAAGLACENGIVVDACMRTGDPSIFAIRDCTSFPIASLGRRGRLESVQNANDQARCAARAIAGDPEPYEALPWFWSEQGASRLQIAGLWEPHHRRMMLGDPLLDKFSILHFDGDRLAAVESINSAADHIGARKSLAGDQTGDSFYRNAVMTSCG